MPSPEAQRVELSSLEVQPHGESFVLGLVDVNHKIHRMELPYGSAFQLLRMLPHLDAALRRARREVVSSPIADVVVRCDVRRTGTEDAVALRLLSDRGVESLHLLASEDALSLFAALGEALTTSASTPLDLPNERRETLN